MSTLQETLRRFQHIGTYMPGPLTCDDGTTWHPAELLPFLAQVEAMVAALARTRNMIRSAPDAAEACANEALAAWKEPS